MRIIKSTIILLFLLGTAHAQDPEERITVQKAIVNDKGVQSIEIVGGNYYFKPNYIIVKKNIPIELSVRKEPGIIPHNIIVDAPEAGVYIKESISTTQKTIEFTLTKTGRYSFYCDKKLLFFKSHREKGMTGIIEVVE